jgi:hypothetical protein
MLLDDPFIALWFPPGGNYSYSTYSRSDDEAWQRLCKTVFRWETDKSFEPLLKSLDRVSKRATSYAATRLLPKSRWSDNGSEFAWDYPIQLEYRETNRTIGEIGEVGELATLICDLWGNRETIKPFIHERPELWRSLFEEVFVEIARRLSKENLELPPSRFSWIQPSELPPRLVELLNFLIENKCVADTLDIASAFSNHDRIDFRSNEAFIVDYYSSQFMKLQNLLRNFCSHRGIPWRLKWRGDQVLLVETAAPRTAKRRENTGRKRSKKTSRKSVGK